MTHVRIGGVLRCCLDREPSAWPASPNEGDTLDCPHGCRSQLIFWNEAWEWFRPDHPARSQEEGR